MALSGHLSNPEDKLRRVFRGFTPPAESRDTAGQRPMRQVQRRLSAEEIEALVAAYAAGRSVRDLARAYTIHAETVRAHLDRAGVPRRAGHTAKLDAAAEATACRLYESGLSLRRVSQQLGVSDNTVLKTLRKHGVQTRSSGRSSHPGDPGSRGPS